VALSTTEFLAPVGPLDAALLFPGKSGPDVAALMGGYLAAANSTVAKLAAVPPDNRDALAYLDVLYLVYDGVVDRMANTPSSFSSADEGSIAFSSAQLKAMMVKRDKALTDYSDAVATFTVNPITDRQPTTSVRKVPQF
jgi:hypothetical protein